MSEAGQHPVTKLGSFPAQGRENLSSQNVTAVKKKKEKKLFLGWFLSHIIIEINNLQWLLRKEHPSAGNGAQAPEFVDINHWAKF